MVALVELAENLPKVSNLLNSDAAPTYKYVFGPGRGPLYRQ